MAEYKCGNWDHFTLLELYITPPKESWRSLQNRQVWLCFSQGSELDLQTHQFWDPMILREFLFPSN